MAIRRESPNIRSMVSRVFTFIQARSNSTRLPRKSLFHAHPDYPVAALCAKRAANKNHSVLVVTSTEKTDDELAKVLEENSVQVFRGDLNNVLKRFFDASTFIDAKENDWIIRLTADNLLPDGYLIEEICQFIDLNSPQFVACSHPVSQLPYGLSAEAFPVSLLNKAYQNATTEHEKEHVTPWMRQHVPISHFPSPLKKNLAYLRCTIDTQEDFDHLKSVFQNVTDPINIPYRELLAKLYQLEKSFESKMILGCAQLGMSYGINNQKGELSEKSCDELLQTSLENGIYDFDSAMDYGKSEQNLGQFFQELNIKPHFITKLSSSTLEVQGRERLQQKLSELISQSYSHFQTDYIDVFLFHRKEQIDQQEGLVIKLLDELKKQGKLGSVGCSLTTASEFEEVASRKKIEYIQLPINILDHRWNHREITQTKKKKNLFISVRSIYLQGLVFLPKEKWPTNISQYADETIRKIQALRQKFNYDSVEALCLSYVNSLPWVDKIVIGCETKEQVEQNLELLKASILTENEIEEINQCFKFLPEEVLNPSKWSR